MGREHVLPPMLEFDDLSVMDWRGGSNGRLAAGGCLVGQCTDGQLLEDKTKVQ
jgi:hypothetical protein